MSGHLVHVWTKLYTFLDLPYLYQKLTKSIFERWKTCKYFQVNNDDAETDIFLGIILSHTVSICGLFFCVVIIAVNWRYIIYNLMCCKQIFSKDFYKFFKTEQVYKKKKPCYNCLSLTSIKKLQCLVFKKNRI